MLITSNNKIKFGKGKAIIKGFVQVLTLISTIKFYVVFINILFLLYLQDIDEIGVRFDNLRNILV